MNVTSIYNLPDNSWYAENENKAQYVGVYIYNVRRHVDGSSYFNRMTLQLHACITWEYWPDSRDYVLLLNVLIIKCNKVSNLTD